MTLTEAEGIIEEYIRFKECYIKFCISNCLPENYTKKVKRELKAFRVALKSLQKRKKSFKTIPVRFTPGDKIYYKDRNGKMQESIVRTVEPVYTHKTREGCKCIFDNTYIGEIIFPRD